MAKHAIMERRHLPGIWYGGWCASSIHVTINVICCLPNTEQARLDNKRAR